MPLVKVSVYIPDGQEKSNHYVEQVLAGMAQLAGGATVVHSDGAYTMADGTLCVEPIRQVSTMIDSTDLARVKALAIRHAREVKTAMAQESVLVTVEPVSECLFV